MREIKLKEKYKAIIEKIENSNKGEKVLERLVRYTCANNVTEAQRNIIYHLQNDDKIYLGVDKNLSNSDKAIVWELNRLDLERNFEETGVGKRGKDTKPRKRRTKAEIENDRQYTKIEIEIKRDSLNTLETYLKAVNLNEKDYFNEIVEKDLKDKKQAIKEINKLVKMLRGDK